MNTVTINLEEYLELRKLRDEVFKKTYYIRYIGVFGGIVSYEFYTNDTAMTAVLDANKELTGKIRQLELKLTAAQTKKKWWQL